MDGLGQQCDWADTRVNLKCFAQLAAVGLSSPRNSRNATHEIIARPVRPTHTRVMTTRRRLIRFNSAIWKIMSKNMKRRGFGNDVDVYLADLVRRHSESLGLEMLLLPRSQPKRRWFNLVRTGGAAQGKLSISFAGVICEMMRENIKRGGFGNRVDVYLSTLVRRDKTQPARPTISLSGIIWKIVCRRVVSRVSCDLVCRRSAKMAGGTN